MNKARYYASVADFHEATRPQNLPSLLARLRARGANISEDAPCDLSTGNFRGESGSWANSLPALAEVLMESNLGEAWIALEYNPYQAGNGRADAVVMGSRDGLPVLLVVELKQWSRSGWDAELQRATDFGARYPSSEHPFRQARDYADFISNYTAGFHEGDAFVYAAAFLHNASEDSIRALRSAGPDEAAGTFAGDAAGRARFVAYLNEHVHGVGGLRTKSLLEHADYKQGPGLLLAAAAMFQDPTAFPLTVEQRDVVHQIQQRVLETKSSRAAKDDAIIVVEGRPGSGKTWICAHLLSLMAEGGFQTALATNSVALREFLRRAAKRTGQGRSTAALVTSARTYHEDKNVWGSLDLLIVDEAQRISEYTIRTGQRNAAHIQRDLEENEITQLFELKKTAKVLVLMVDEQQQSTATDHLTVEHAEQMARRFGAEFIQLSLTEQHRSGGSKVFEEWVLSLTHDEPSRWEDEANFTVDVADSPADMEHRLTKMAQGGETRIVAGFTWPWSNWPDGARSLDDIPFDIEIGDWRRRWNLRKSIDGYPKADDWASKPEGAEQVGSVFTAQGFEFPYVGVLMGPDLVARDGRLVVNPEATAYGSLGSKMKKNREYEDRIRNQYLVLMTRGMKGVVLHSTDTETQAFLKSLVNPGM